MIRLAREPKEMKGLGQQNPYHRGYDVNHIDIACSSFHQDFDDENIGIRIRRHPRDNLKDFKIEVSKFDRNLNIKNYLD